MEANKYNTPISHETSSMGTPNYHNDKTQVFNVIILDKSGSMDYIRQAAIDGINEILNGIKRAQEKFSDTQQHYVSLVAFCCCGFDYIYDKSPVANVHPLKDGDYIPCCRTPLYDAMGISLNTMRKHVLAIEDAVVIVTIITDGYENASKEYNSRSIKELVSQLKKEGWSFTFMGADQDALEVAKKMAIRNSRNFEATESSTHYVMNKDLHTRMNFFSRLHDIKHSKETARLSGIDRKIYYTSAADAAFDEEEDRP